jgi:hypothetical protein
MRPWLIDRDKGARSLLPAAALAGVGARKGARKVSASRFTPAEARAIEGKNELLAASRDKPRPLVSLDSRESPHPGANLSGNHADA